MSYKDDIGWDLERIDKELEDFQSFAPGPVKQGRPMDPAQLTKYKEIFPPIISMLWDRVGIGHMLNRAYWLCEPDLLAPVIELVFRGDPDFDPKRTHAYAYTAFGTVVAWNEGHWDLEIDFINGIVTADVLLYPEKKKGVNLHSISGIQTFESIEDLNVEDEEGKFLYGRAKKKLGALEEGEIYGFVPALAMGGPATLEKLRKVPVVSHLAFLAQMQEFILKDYLARPIREIRLIGPQP